MPHGKGIYDNVKTARPQRATDTADEGEDQSIDAQETPDVDSLATQEPPD